MKWFVGYSERWKVYAEQLLPLESGDHATWTASDVARWVRAPLYSYVRSRWIDEMHPQSFCELSEQRKAASRLLLLEVTNRET